MFQRDQPELCTKMKRHSSQTKHHMDSSTNNKQTASPSGAAAVATKQAAIIHGNTKHQSEVVSCLQLMKCSEQTATDVAPSTLLAEAAASQQPLQVNDPLSTLTAAAAAAAYSDNDDIAEELPQRTSPRAVDHEKSPPANASSASRNAEDNGMVVSHPKEATKTKLRGESGIVGAGVWTKAEHDAFLLGLETHGKNWKFVAGMIKTRTVVQTRTHAQKYFLKLQRWDVKKKKVCYINYIYHYHLVFFFIVQISNTYSFLLEPTPLSAGRVDKDNDTIDY